MRWGEQLEEWIEARRWLVMSAVGGLILIGVGVGWWRMGTANQESGVQILSSQVEASSSGLMVDVAGAVARPGVYTLRSGARVEEAVQLAGGLTENADREWVSKYLNRSEKISDGQKIYIPGKNSQESNNNEQTGSVNQILTSKININAASQSELETLSGVGPVTAMKIINGRPYGRVEELVERKIVGQSVWSKISEAVTVW